MSNETTKPWERILVTGSTGYVGGRLVPRLIERADARIRLFVRDRTRVQDRGWNGVEIFEGEALQYEDVKKAVQDVDIIFYLIHSMRSGEKEFADRDRLAAENFSRAAKENKVKKIIYLGGLGASGLQELSEHLASRQETGDLLRLGGTQVIEFRAGMIIGSGGLSFEMLRYLTERLPIMIAPRWILTPTQPISIRDVLAYLLAALDLESPEHEIFEIGGPDVLNYEQMIQIYANERGLKRFIIRVPVLTPRLSSYWITACTPIPASIVRPLVEGLKNDLLVTCDKALKRFSIKPMSFRSALKNALDRTISKNVETHWSTALSSSLRDLAPVKLISGEGLIIEERRVLVSKPPDKVFQSILGIGGKTGWLYANWLWRVRGFIDRWIGGVGLRRGRRSENDLQTGDALDFWRVEALEKPKLLRLRAEMKVPGKAWLEFRVLETPNGTQIIQKALFEPKGVLGLLYWYGIYPLHALIFKGLIQALAQKAETEN